MSTDSSLLKTLVKCGIGSRRVVADAIRQGRVTVNDRVVEDFRHPLNLETDRISIDGREVRIRPGQLVYLMLNKPKGVITTTRDERGRRTVVDILPGKYRNLGLHPVGRLDKDTTGLLLLTNDGELTYKLTHPSFECEKEYLVQIEARLRPGERRKLEQGIKTENGVSHPAIVREVESCPPFNYSLTIHEGRKRQIRRMLGSLGQQCLALKRIRIGGLSIGNLQEGNSRHLQASEVRLLFQS